MSASSAYSTSFQTPSVISGNVNGEAQYPMIATSGSHVYVVWGEVKSAVYFRASSDSGSTWGTTLKLGGGTVFPVISASEQYVYVVWQQAGYVYFAGSSNYGASFSKGVAITNYTGITPYVASSGQYVYVSYALGDASYLTWSDNAGAKWAGTMKISLDNGSHHEPQVAAYGTSAYAISDGSGGVLLTHNGGATWTKTKFGACCASEPWIAVYGNTVLAAGETKLSTSRIEIAYSTNAGNTFKVLGNFSGSIKNSWAPMVAVSGNTMYVAWRTSPGGKNSQEYVTANSGSGWTVPKAIGFAGHDNEWPFSVAVNGSNAYVMWDYQYSSSPNVWHAAVSYSGNSGSTWTSPIDLSTNSSQAVPENDIATGAAVMSGSVVYVVWENPSYQIDFTSGTG